MQENVADLSSIAVFKNNIRPKDRAHVNSYFGTKIFSNPRYILGTEKLGVHTFWVVYSTPHDATSFVIFFILNLKCYKNVNVSLYKFFFEIGI